MNIHTTLGNGHAAASDRTAPERTVPERLEAVSAILRTGPFSEALRAAIAARGLSLDRLQQRLAARGARVGVATLSCWQSGTRRPERPASLRAVSVLEEVLALPAGALVVLLGPPRPRGPGAASRRDRAATAT